MSECCFNCKKTTKFNQKTVSLLCVKTKSGAHKQLTFYFQMWKYFCRHLHSSLIYRVQPKLLTAKENKIRWNFLFDNIQFCGNLFTIERYCTIDTFSEYRLLWLKFLYIFIQKLFKMGGGWDKHSKYCIFEHKLPAGFISLTTVPAKWLKLAHDFVKTSSCTLQFLSNSF